MFLTFFGFELRYWLRSMMLYVFLFVVTLMVCLAVSNENVRIGTGVDNTMRNAPFVVQMFYGVIGILTTVMVAAFVNTAASREFTTGMHPIIFTQPIRKMQFLLGRFCGSTLVATIPMIGVSLGAALALYMPWTESEYYGPTIWNAHFSSFMLFVVPNTIFIAAIVYAIAVFTRSAIASFMGAILVIVASSVSSALVGNLDNETLSALVEPFGLSAFSNVTQYWTVSEKNTQFVGLTGIFRFGENGTLRLLAPSFQLDYWRNHAHGVLLANRLIWTSVGLGLFAVASWAFQFSERRTTSRKPAVADPVRKTPRALPAVHYQHGGSSNFARFCRQVRSDFFGIVKSNVFLVLMFAAMLNTITSLAFGASQGFGLRAFPVTYNVISIIQGSLYIFLLATIVYFAGALVWRERDVQIDEIFDALPQPTWIAFCSKLVSLMLVVAAVMSAGMISGMIVQACQGYTRFQLPLYLTELFTIDMVTMFSLAVVALLCHVLAPNKYAGYFLFVIFIFANTLGWSLLEVRSNMLQYGDLPSHIYSDLYRFAPFTSGLRWFSIYWLLFSGFVCIVAMIFWQRGKESSLRHRAKLGIRRVSRGVFAATAFLIIAFVSVAGWTYYNTQVRNTYDAAKTVRKLQADYEKQFKQHEGIAQPRITRVRYTIDIYPQRRGLHLVGEQTIKNRSDETIDRLFLNMPDDEYDTKLTIEGAELTERMDEFDVHFYEFDPPMEPGETREMRYVMRYEPNGFENSVSNTSIVQNGTFFNNGIVPQIGYQSNAELTDKKQREKFDLEPSPGMPPLEPDNMKTRSNTYISNNSDWVDVETTISTDADQIAIAPGSLTKSWEKDGRRYFHYQVDHPSLNFYSFISARYQVATRKWNGVDIEVYYHPDHTWNVENMLRSIQKSLEYYTTNFGPYHHKQARIIEFPRVASFAQAFPGTMPYSEGIGFIADIEKEDDIDMVFYVVAHEMAHQWWAHQLCGANMQGATLLSETLAQYSALMVMEHEYGRDMMRKFLRYEMDQYLAARGRDMLDETPLAKVQAQQGYIHYRKGSVVMYYLREMVGEEAINAALRQLIREFAYQGPPYPTSADLLTALRQQIPDTYQYLLSDLFEEITLFANRTKDATVVERPDGTFDVTIQVECRKFKADKQGVESEVPVDDWIEIGALAEPEKGKRYGATLYRERRKITETENQFTFTVTEMPRRVGIDPFALLIDRLPSDNLKKPRLVSDTHAPEVRDSDASRDSDANRDSNANGDGTAKSES